MRILLCEDEPKMAALIKRVLTAERHVVDVVPDGVSALALGHLRHVRRGHHRPDAARPRRALGHPWTRAKGVTTPVLLLTALGSVEHRVAGLDAGADDYLPKPFAFTELLARVRALARRDSSSTVATLASGDLELDETRHVARVGERSVDLSAREFALLGYLIRHAGQVLTRQQILDAVWGAEPDVYSNVVDLYIHYLRRKLEELDRADRLRTVRGVGYVLRPSEPDRRPAPMP